MADFLTREKERVAEIVLITVPVLIEAVAAILMIGCGLLWMIIASTPQVPF